jgi:hypothetical protein
VVVDGELRTINGRRNRVVVRRPLGPPVHWRVESAVDGLLLWTVPVVSPFEAPGTGRIVSFPPSEPERQRVKGLSLALGLGPGSVLRIVHVRGNEVIVVSDNEVRGYRGASREVK